MKASELFLLCSGVLQDLGDPAGERWPWAITAGKVSLTDLFNSAVREIALQRPDATAHTEAIKLGNGVMQSLPVAGSNGATKTALRLIEVIQNMGSDGETPGEPIFISSKDAMKAFDWTTSGTEIDNYAYDAKENPDTYWVYPGVTTGEDVYISMTYSAEPEAITGPDDDVPLPETFAGPIKDWILYQVFAGDNSDANFAKAQHRFNAFYQSLGVKLKADLFYPKQVQVVEG